ARRARIPSSSIPRRPRSGLRTMLIAKLATPCWRAAILSWPRNCSRKRRTTWSGSGAFTLPAPPCRAAERRRTLRRWRNRKRTKKPSWQLRLLEEVKNDGYFDAISRHEAERPYRGRGHAAL